MKKTYLIILMLIGSISFSIGQQVYFDCVEQSRPSNLKNSNCGTNSIGDWVRYYDMNTWVPRMDADPLRNAPIMYIQISFNIYQKNDGSGNFQDTPNDRLKLLNLLDRLNYVYSTGAPSDPISWVTELPGYDTRIRFTLGSAGQERIFFYRNDDLYGEYQSSEFTNFINDSYPDRAQYLNVHFSGDGYYGRGVSSIEVINGGSGYTSAPTIKFSSGGAQAIAYINNGKVTSVVIPPKKGGSYSGNSVESVPTVTSSGGGGTGLVLKVNMSGGAGAYASYPNTSLSFNQYVVMLRQDKGSYDINDTKYRGELLAHEFGHCFDLTHIFESTSMCNDDDDYLEDLYGHQPGNCPHISAWDLNPYLSSSDNSTNDIMTYGPAETRIYITPLQAGLAHRALSVLSTKKYVSDVYSNVAYLIENISEVWDFEMRLYRDLIISSGGNLKIECKLEMPSTSQIVVNSSGKLTIDGTIVSVSDNELFKGIIVKNGGVLQIESGDITYPIIIEKGGLLEIPANSIFTVSSFGKIIAECSSNVSVISGASISLSGKLNVINFHSNVIFQNLTFNEIKTLIVGSGSINNFTSNGNFAGNYLIDSYLTGIVLSNSSAMSISNNSTVILEAEKNIYLNPIMKVYNGSEVKFFISNSNCPN